MHPDEELQRHISQIMFQNSEPVSGRSAALIVGQHGRMHICDEESVMYIARRIEISRSPMGMRYGAAEPPSWLPRRHVAGCPYDSSCRPIGEVAYLRKTFLTVGGKICEQSSFSNSGVRKMR